jgi:predicted nucleic acid-binding protein
MTPRRTARAPAKRMRERGPRYTSAISEPVVVDASIAYLWFANEPDRSGADEPLQGEAPLLAPDLMAVEAANTWWKKLRRNEMARADVEQAITNLLALGIAWTPSPMLLPSAARLAVELGHPVYDCLYLALAASHAAPLVTADKRLQQAAGRIGVRVKT